MKEYKIVSKTIYGGKFYDKIDSARVEEEEIEEEINRLSKDGWVVKCFNITSYSKDLTDLHYYALMERDVT